jgi:hypothetical protein
VFVVPFGEDRPEIICTFARYVKRQVDPFSTGNVFKKRNTQITSWLDKICRKIANSTLQMAYY